jgi:hypothetical protein
VSGKKGILFAKRGGDNERVKIDLKNDGSGEGRVNVDFKDDPGMGHDGITSTKTYTDGEWHHILVVRDVDTDSIELYVDGEQVGNTTDTQGDINPTGAAYLGAQPEYPNNRYYTGQLDDVRVYKRTVTLDEAGAPSQGPPEIEPICDRCESPTDIDGDGKYEDVNGNDIQGFGDVVTLFENLGSEPVTENTELYDYNDNGVVGFGDVIQLFETI